MRRLLYCTAVLEYHSAMRSTSIRWLRASLAVLLVASNTALHALPILLLAILRALLPLRFLRRRMSAWMPALGESWIAVNNWTIDCCTPTRWVLSGDRDFDPGRRYLVLSNHQSWLDIPVLQRVLNRRIPFLRFFLKSSLRWVPVLGLVWWALDFPFMKRAGKSQVQKDPTLGRRDFETARRTCQRFREIPVAIMNFVEGTRADATKLAQSPHRHLLKPKSGGVAQVLDSMGELLDGIVDVTIVYPDGRHSAGDFLLGRVAEIRVDLRLRPVPAELLGGDYENDREHRLRVQSWLNGLWAEKDARIEELLVRS